MEGTLSELLLPCRKAAAQASQAFADQLESESDNSDAQISGSYKKKKDQRKVSRKRPVRGGKPLKTYGKKAMARVATGISSPSTLARPPVLRVTMKSSPPSSVLDDTCTVGDETKSKGLPVLKRAKMQPKTPKIFADSPSYLSSIPSSRAGSLDSEIEIVEDFAPAAFSFPSHFSGSSLKQFRSKDEMKRRKNLVMSPEALGTYVWVLIEPENVRVHDPTNEKESYPYGIWWPGKARIIYIYNARNPNIDLDY